MAGTLRLESGTAPATPPSGTIHIYSKIDKKLYVKDDTGTEYEVSLGASLADTDDLPEGSLNLYFTEERAQDAIGSIVTSSATISLVYDDVLNTLTASISNGTITNTYISNSAAIDTTKLADGSVSNTEFQYLNGVTGSIQTQIDSKASKAGDTFSGPVTIASQVAPSIPPSGITVYADNSGDESLAWVSQSGYSTTLKTDLLTDNRTLQIPDTDAVLMVDPMITDGDIIYRNSGVATALPVGNEDDILRVVSGLPVWQEENLTQGFGDASDGNLTVSGVLTVTQIQYWDTLTIEAGAAININGYPIYCRTLDLTNATTPRAIHRNGNNGANTSTNVAAGGGAALAVGILGQSTAGSNGAGGSTGAGAASAAPVNAQPSNGGNGGNSGASGAGGIGAGAAVGAGGTASIPTHLGRFEYQFLRGATIIQGGCGGDGGNSGGGDGVNSSRAGGGGGGGAGVVAIYAAEIITSVSTSADLITAIGGAAGNQTNAPALGNCGGAGGAGGGGGGYVYLTYVKRTGPAVSGLINASGGLGGNGSNGLGTGLGGNGGQGGAGGRIQIYNVTTGVGQETVGPLGATGTAASGITGGAGGNGGNCVASI